jgi:hypothetical protein
MRFITDVRDLDPNPLRSYRPRMDRRGFLVASALCVLPFPSLTFAVLPQVYRREGQQMYRYESGDGALVRLLEVNASGFVTSYPGLWVEESHIQLRFI